MLGPSVFDINNNRKPVQPIELQNVDVLGTRKGLNIASGYQLPGNFDPTKITTPDFSGLTAPTIAKAGE